MATITFTINTASSPWVYSNGIATTVLGTSQTFKFDFNDTGAGGDYFGAGVTSQISLADGNKLDINMDKGFTFFQVDADATSKTSAGAIQVKSYLNKYEQVNVVAVTMANADGTGADNLTSITFEYPGKPYRWTWANVDMA